MFYLYLLAYFFMGKSDRSFKNVLIRKIGQILGRVKAKDPDLFDAFIETCNATGQKPSDVIMNFIAWFIEQGGQTIIDVGAISKQKKIGETFAELQSVEQIAEMAKKAIADNLQREMELKQTLIQISQDYANTFAQLQQQTAELQRQLLEFRKQQEELTKERQRLEVDKAQVAQAAKELQDQWKQLEKAQKELLAMRDALERQRREEAKKQPKKEK